MKIATWNVNGIRARAAQVCDWIDARAARRRLPAGDQGAPDQFPDALRARRTITCTGTAAAATPASRCTCARDASPSEPAFAHPPFDLETRIVTAERRRPGVRLGLRPNGGKDFAAKMRFLTRAGGVDARSCTPTGRAARPVRRLQRRAHRLRRAPELAQADVIGQRPEERELFERMLADGLVDVGRALDPDNDGCSPGGRRGATCASATSAGGSTTCSRRATRGGGHCCRLADVGTSDHAPVMMTFP